MMSDFFLEILLYKGNMSCFTESNWWLNTLNRIR